MTTPKNPPTTRATCGKYAGYQAHRKANEITCRDCRAARNQWEIDRRAARRQAADRATLTKEEHLVVMSFMERGINHALMVEFIESRIADRLLRYT